MLEGISELRGGKMAQSWSWSCLVTSLGKQEKGLESASRDRRNLGRGNSSSCSQNSELTPHLQSASCFLFVRRVASGHTHLCQYKTLLHFYQLAAKIAVSSQFSPSPFIPICFAVSV